MLAEKSYENGFCILPLIKKNRFTLLNFMKIYDYN